MLIIQQKYRWVWVYGSDNENKKYLFIEVGCIITQHCVIMCHHNVCIALKCCTTTLFSFSAQKTKIKINCRYYEWSHTFHVTANASQQSRDNIKPTRIRHQSILGDKPTYSKRQRWRSRIIPMQRTSHTFLCYVFSCWSCRFQNIFYIFFFYVMYCHDWIKDLGFSRTFHYSWHVQSGYPAQGKLL